MDTEQRPGTAEAAADVAATVEEALTTRRSVRAYLPVPVPRQTVEEILALASRAPSGTNIQPWKVTVVSGAAKRKLSDELLAAHFAGGDGHKNEYQYYANPLPEPYIGRRRKVGWDLYGLLGIKKGDREGTLKQHARNYMFFDAPVGLFFSTDRIMQIGNWFDYGMFLENVMIAARGKGLHTCPQAAFAQYHKIIRRHLDIPEDQVVICGMSMGYEDKSAPENQLRTERAPVSEFARFIDYD